MPQMIIHEIDLGLNVRTSYVRNSYEFAVSKQVGMPGNFQHVMTSVTLSKKNLHQYFILFGF